MKKPIKKKVNINHKYNVYAHEAAHAVVALCSGISVRSISLKNSSRGHLIGNVKIKNMESLQEHELFSLAIASLAGVEAERLLFNSGSYDVNSRDIKICMKALVMFMHYNDEFGNLPSHKQKIIIEELFHECRHQTKNLLKNKKLIKSIKYTAALLNNRYHLSACDLRNTTFRNGLGRMALIKRNISFKDL